MIKKYTANKSLKTRGGFVSRIPPIRIRTNSGGFSKPGEMFRHFFYDQISSASERILFSMAHKSQARLMDLLNGANVNRKTTIGSIYNGHGSLFPSPSNYVSYSVRNTSQNVILGEATSRIYNTRLNLGRPNSRRLNTKSFQLVRAEKLIKDSNRDYKSVRKRSTLTANFGFNQRLYSFMLEDLYTTVKDIRILYSNKWSSYERNFASKGIHKTLYADFLSENLKFNIKSESDHYSVIAKIHLVKIHDSNKNLYTIAQKCFPNQKSTVIDAIPADMRFGKLKKNYQFNATCLSDLNCTLNKSSYFKSNCTIVKTFQRSLGPSDTWKFNYTLKYGPGIILNNIFQDKDEYHPIAYAFIVDLQGDPRASVTDDNGLNYDGSSPGRVNFNFERKISLIKEQDWDNSGEVFTVSQFEDQSNDFENEELIDYFTQDREERMNINFEDINIIRGTTQQNIKYNLRYSEGRIPTYSSAQYVNLVDIESLNLSNSTKTKDNQDQNPASIGVKKYEEYPEYSQYSEHSSDFNEDFNEEYLDLDNYQGED